MVKDITRQKLLGELYDNRLVEELRDFPYWSRKPESPTRSTRLAHIEEIIKALKPF